MSGHAHTDESRRKIAEGRLGWKHTTETKARLREMRLALPVKRFCSRGHDTLVPGGRVGPDRGSCRACKTYWGRNGILNPDGSLFGVIDYDRAYQVQGGSCLGCRRHQTEFDKALSVDHDHATGVFRGLLCRDCNYALGCVKDDADVLDRLAKYLKESR